MGPRRFVGRRARRLVAEALAEARRRRPSSATGPILAPFALVARGEGSIELEVTEAGDRIEALVTAIAREAEEQPAVVVFEAAAGTTDVFVLDLFTRDAPTAVRSVVRIDDQKNV